MEYYLNKLRFTTAVHFGSAGNQSMLEGTALTLEADTLFSALCIEAERIIGPGGAAKLAVWAQTGQLRISSLLPYGTQGLYVPRPVLLPGKLTETPQVQENRKKYKTMHHIPADALGKWVSAVSNGIPMVLETENFAEVQVVTKVAVTGHEEPQPWHMGTASFNKGKGLYCLVGAETETVAQTLDVLTKSLGVSGIGGKTTAGLGRFESGEGLISLEKATDQGAKPLLDALHHPGNLYMSLNPILPTKEELEAMDQNGSAYTLIYRKGFIRQYGKGEAQKKKHVGFFGTGSTFTAPMTGQLADVGQGISHPVYRYGLGLFLGLKRGA